MCPPALTASMLVRPLPPRQRPCTAYLSIAPHVVRVHVQGLVKEFFNEKEVTSTLVMDALYSGCKQVEEHSRLYLEVGAMQRGSSSWPKAHGLMFSPCSHNVRLPHVCPFACDIGYGALRMRAAEGLWL